MQRVLIAVLLCGPLYLFPPPASAEDAPVDPYENKVHKASDEGTKAIKRMQVPKGLVVDLFAAEPHVANIVSFCIDEKGRFYVAETFRLHQGVSDNRGKPWLDDDLAARTVADRLAMYKKYLGKDYPTYGKEHDRIRLVEDTRGTGKADKATVFADGFKDPAEGLGSGVLARHGKVWYTCIPDLWLLQDTKGTGRADVKKSLQTGYGVHVSFIGHDMHGLKMGPDGKLYFSIGDRGLHVESAGHVVDNPDSGAVLRCDPDGSHLEIVAIGLRNPQELAFDKHGNLFTGDNNADGGDAARWVQIVEGGDSGWRIGYQYMNALGPWNAEKMWHVSDALQPAHVVPPLAHIANGPAGLTYFPGTGQLPVKYQDHFFLVDFRGSSGGSGIHAFALKPKGASFELIDRHQFVWSVLATDCDFGPDGAFYLSDWVEGWGLTNKGRIYKVSDPTLARDATVLEVKKLLADGFKKPAAELAGLLEHKDMRVRQEAQFALADLGAVAELSTAARSGGPLARLHAIWGLGQAGRKNTNAFTILLPLLADKDAEVRAQSLKVLGDGHVGAAFEGMVAGLKDPEARVRFFAALALGKIGKAEALPAVLDMLRVSADSDAYLRHAGVMALVGIGDRKALHKAAEDPAPPVRLAVCLAMRRLAMPEIARFLNDTDARVGLEAARAIYEAPIPEALPALAALLIRPAGSQSNASVPLPIQEALYLRILNANFRLGKKENAQAIAAFAARPGAPEKMRLEALEELSQWEKPSGRDRVLGLWRPLQPRSRKDVADVLRPALAGIMTASDKVRAAGAKLAAKYGIKEIGPVLRALVEDTTRSASARVETLKALEMLKDDKLGQLAEGALKDPDPRLRHEGRRLVLAKKKPGEAALDLSEVLERGAMIERQGALGLLAGLKAPEADRVLSQWLDKLLDQSVPAEIQLDILEAAKRRGTTEFKEKLAKYQAALPKKDHLAGFREALAGGDADSGRRIFFDKTDLSCLRCHKISGVGGEVGPDLTGIGKKQKRDYLLEAIVDPNKQIAKGFETVVLVLANGQVKSGILKSEDAKEVRLMTPEGQTLVVSKEQIEERSRGPSAMPADLVQKMSRSELRDLVEFLSSLQ